MAKTNLHTHTAVARFLALVRLSCTSISAAYLTCSHCDNEDRQPGHIRAILNRMIFVVSSGSHFELFREVCRYCQTISSAASGRSSGRKLWHSSIASIAREENMHFQFDVQKDLQIEAT